MKKSTKATTSSKSLAATAFCADHVVMSHGAWFKNHPKGTLEELNEFLDSVLSEMENYDSNELIADHIDDLCDAAEYLADFQPPTEPVCDDELATFEYRLVNVEEDIMYLEELIELVGESFKVADLPSREELSTSSSPKLAG